MADGLKVPRTQYQSKKYDAFIDPELDKDTFSAEVWVSGSLKTRKEGFVDEELAREWIWLAICNHVEDEVSRLLFPEEISD